MTVVALTGLDGHALHPQSLGKCDNRMTGFVVGGRFFGPLVHFSGCFSAYWMLVRGVVGKARAFPRLCGCWKCRVLIRPGIPEADDRELSLPWINTISEPRRRTAVGATFSCPSHPSVASHCDTDSIPALRA